MNFVFRADASIDIGTGHVMRCLTLADALRKNGARCRFICRDHPGNLINLIHRRGFDARTLPINKTRFRNEDVQDETISEYTHWLGTDWLSDAKQTHLKLGDMKVDWLIVDHYALDIRWESYLRSACSQMMVIDDLADRPHDCDLLLDQNFGRCTAEYANLVPEGCNVLIGPKYALLRPEFFELRSRAIQKRNNNHSIEKILLFMGGGLQSENIKLVLDTLKVINWKKKPILDLVINEDDPIIKELNKKDLKYPLQVNIRSNIKNIAELMLEAEFAIGSAGSATWERCTLGLPSLVKVVAANQKIIANNLEQAGAVFLWESSQELNDGIIKLISSFSSRKEMAKLAFNICDGMGAERLISAAKM